jgi:hypothetical protein
MLVKRRRAPVYNLGTRGKYIVLYACSAWMCQDVLGFFSSGWVSGLGVFYEHTRRHSTGSSGGIAMLNADCRTRRRDFLK